MPQFDLSQYGSQIFWLILCFAMLYIYTFTFILPRMRHIQQVRFDATAGKVACAVEVQQKITALKSEFDEKLKAAHVQAHNDITMNNHNFNENMNHQKATIDQEVKQKYMDQENIILNSLSHNKKVQQEHLQQYSDTITDQILQSHLGVAHDKPARKTKPRTKDAK